MDPSSLLARAKGRHGASVVAASPIAAGAALLRLDGPIREAPTRYSVQMDAGVHVCPESRLWGLSNHSCSPNCRIDFATWTLVAARPILEGEEITWNYLTTEWEMQSPFQCLCGSPGCLGHIRGFAHLPQQERDRLAPHLSPYLLRRRFDRMPAPRPAGAAAPKALAAHPAGPDVTGTP